jgi:hypothetical protein
VIPAAYMEEYSFIVQKGTTYWGTFDEMENLVRLSNEDTEGAQDLMIMQWKKQCLRRRSISFRTRKKPDASEMAAIFRYNYSVSILNGCLGSIHFF